MNKTLATLSAALVGIFPAMANSHDIRAVADDHLTSTPKRGYLMACRGANPNAPVAQADGPWIRNGTLYPADKIVVQGEVNWTKAQISVATSNQSRVIQANNLPLHSTGTFPVAASDPASQYDRNPNQIRAQNIDLHLPLDPEVAANPTCLDVGAVAFMLTNVSLFNAVDARGQDAAAHEIMDSCNGHPEARGVYHYHTISPCQTDKRDANGHSEVMGYALDGFGVFGPYTGLGSAQVTNAELDECHGHIGEVIWQGKVQSIYHYHLNNEFPFSIGCFRGTPIK